MTSEPAHQETILPVVRQPRGKAYFLGTWSGRLQIVNTLVFLAMIIMSPSSLLMPDPDFMASFGIKSLPEIARGEYWRFITPMFVHIGAIHFAFNTMGLNYIGYQLEYMLGGRWFILLYLLSGIVGNVASCVFSIKASAGASGALFGLLGAGFVLENSVSHKLAQHFGPRPRRRVYSGMVLLNIMLGLFIPVIDNAAHGGGLICGIVFVRALLWLRPNQLETPRPLFGRLAIASVFAFLIGGVIYTVNPKITINRFLSAAKSADSVGESWIYTREALKVDEHNPETLVWAGRLLILADHEKEGVEALREAIDRGVSDQSVNLLIEELGVLGRGEAAEQIRDVLAQRKVI